MMSRISQAKNDTDMISLISENVKLRKSGNSYVGCCPFHAEKTGSFHVYEKRYYCYGCGAKGDAISWCLNYLKLDFRSALDFLLGAEAKQEYQPGGHIEDYGSFEDRVEKCKQTMPPSVLIRALLEPRIPAVLRKYAHIGVHPIDGIDGLSLIIEYFKLRDDTLGQWEALRLWEDLINQRWIPY